MAEIVPPRVSPGPQIFRRALKNRALILSSIVLLVIFLVAIFAPAVAPYDPYKQSLVRRLVPPVWLGGSWANPLGTDGLGRDMLSRLIYGSRVSLLIGFVSAGLSAIIGTALGVSAGYFGGRVDRCVQFLINVRLAMPATLVALATVSLVGRSMLVVIVVLGLLLWDRFAVVLRSAAMQIRSMEYVAAAEMLGAPKIRILWKDILPNVMNHLIVIMTLEMTHAITLEAALSFLGLGVQPPTPSWGLMLSEGKDLLFFDSWLIMIPGVALFTLVLAINVFGDGIRDVTTPEGRT